MKQVFTSVIILVAVIACKQKVHEHHDRTDGFSETPSTAIDSLYKEVLDGHDIGMAKLGKVKAGISRTKAGLDSILKLKDSPVKEKLQKTYKSLEEDLTYAEYSMNTWMNEFNPDSAVDNADARLKYLTDEKLKIDKVKESILSSLHRADSLFKK